jgi:hypothetical protein
VLTAADVKWTDAAQVMVAIVGLAVLWRQLSGVRMSLEAETLGHLYSHYHDVISIFRTRPELRAYVFGDRRLNDAADAGARAELDTTCELVAGLFEHAWVQHENLSRAPWEECWSQWMRDSVARSYELRRFLEQNRVMYVKGFLDDVMPSGH